MDKNEIFKQADLCKEKLGNEFTELIDYMVGLFEVQSKLQPWPHEYIRACHEDIADFCEHCLKFECTRDFMGHVWKQDYSYYRFVVSEESYKLLKEVNKYLKAQEDF